MNFKAIAFILILLYSSVSFASPLVAVSISPGNGTQIDEIYAFENSEYIITVLNNEPLEINNFRVKISTEKGIEIIDEEGKTRTEQEFPPLIMPPGAIDSKTITFTAKENKDAEYRIFIDYGISEFTHQTVTSIKTRKNMIEFDAQLEEMKTKAEEKNRLLIEFRNNSNKKIRNLKIELEENEFIEIKTKPIEFQEFSPNESISNKAIEFINVKEINKPVALKLRISYSDELGKHELIKSVELKAKNENIFLLASAGIVILIILGYMFLNKPKELPLQEPPQRQSSLEEEKNRLLNE
ncbi:MAG: hypothetical protein ABIA76_02890 [Candidatus Diapherotrites archaeon]